VSESFELCLAKNGERDPDRLEGVRAENSQGTGILHSLTSTGGPSGSSTAWANLFQFSSQRKGD